MNIHFSSFVARLSFAAIFPIFASSACAVTLTWTNTTSGNFSVAANWSPNQVPTAADDVTLENTHTVGTHTVIISGQESMSTTAENSGQTTILQLGGSYGTGPFQLFSGGGLVELTGGGTMTAESLGNLDLLISGANLNVSGTTTPNSCTVDGFNSSFQCPVLQAAMFIVTNSGSATCDSISNAGGGSYSVGGGGSLLTVHGECAPDTLDIGDGGVTSAGGAYSGTRLHVDGSGSQLQVAGAFAPAGQQLPQTIVTNGGEIQCATAQIGTSLPTSVSGSGSLLSVSGELDVSNFASVNVQGGGGISAQQIDTDSLGLVVKDTNSLVQAQQNILVGNSASGAFVEIKGGGHLQSGGGAIGNASIASGQVVVHDAGSAWISLNNGLAVANGGSGTLTVSNGGLMQIQGSPGTNDTLIIGISAGPAGTVNVQDSNSLLDANVGTVTVGYRASGTLNVRQNGAMDAGTVIVGTTNATGFVNASTGGTMTLSSDLLIGNGQVQVVSGASLKQRTTGSHLGVGALGGVTGSLTVDGTGSKYDHTGGLMIVGSAGTGNVRISNGGELDVDLATLGQPAATGNMTVTSAGSLFRVFDTLAVGGSTHFQGPGTLTVTNGGLVQIDAQMKIFPQGTIFIPGGIINVGSSNVAAAGVLRVSTGGRLDNAGTVQGQVLVAMGGTLGAGPGDGTCSITGDFQLDSGGLLSLDFTGTNAGSGYDVLNASGNVSLSGTVALNFLDGFAPKAGNTFTFLKFGTNLSGAFNGVQLSGLAPGFQYLIQTNNHALVLVAENDGVATSPPLLTITQSGGQVMVNWPASAAGFALQGTTNLASTNWVNISTTTNQFLTSPTNTMRFFRLFK